MNAEQKELPSKQMWNALVRVVSIDQSTRCFIVIIPSWNPKRNLTLAINDLPTELTNKIKAGTRLSCTCNIGAENREDLIFRNWSILKL